MITWPVWAVVSGGYTPPYVIRPRLYKSPHREGTAMSPDELRCACCVDYLFNGPVQCSCGDRVCTPCFSSLSGNAAKFACVKCKAEISVEECFQDRAATIELKKATLQCTSPGCSCQGSSEEYLKYGCQDKIGRSDLPVHEAKCAFMPTKCKWCGRHTRDEKIHHRECISVPQGCTSGCGVSTPRKEMERHMKTTCTHQPKQCEFIEEGCQYMGHVKDLEEHYATNMKKHIQLSKNSLKRLEKSMDSKLMALSQQLSDLKSEINYVHREISVMMQPVASAVSKAETAIQNLQERFSELALMVQTLQATSYDGSFIWKIPEIQRRRHEAKIGKTISLYSAPFHTSRQGCKACLRLYMDGDGCGKNIHLSFFLTLMKGEYDALFQWPFRHTVTLTLLDQDGDKNIAQSFKPESTSSSFQRPRNQMNIASGCPMFAPLSVLNNSSYVKDDTMFLKCEIDTSGIKLP